MQVFGHVLSLVTCLIALLLTSAAMAGEVFQGERDNSWSGTTDNYQEPWKELTSVLPPAPIEKNLIVLSSDRFSDDYEYVIDRNSTSLQSDKVFRYTVVVRTPTGVSNGFYEGISCENRNYKTYGILTDNGFQKTLGSSWQPMRKSGITIFRLVLLDEYVCTGHSRPASLDTINARLDKSEASNNRKFKVRRRDLET